jgi:ketosteroid isomerase-like protein
VSQESTTPGSLELVRGLFEAMNRRDLNAAMSLHAADAEWDVSNTAAGKFAGAPAVRGFLDDWYGAFEQWEGHPEELVDLGSGVVFALVHWNGRPAGSVHSTDALGALVFELAGPMIGRVTVYTRSGVGEARAAAERLAGLAE